MTPLEAKVRDKVLEIFEGFDEETCSKCEGSGLVYADGKAHYPHSNAKTVSCSYCHEGKRAISDETRTDIITTSILALIEGEVAKRDEQIESLDDQLEASMVERYQILIAIHKFVDDYKNQGGIISELQAVLDKYAWSK